MITRLYLHAESERTRLRDVLRQYGITDPLSQSEQVHKASDVRPSTEAAQDILSPLTTQLLISPLPEVAGTILQTSAMGSFMALPDVDECCDKKIPKPERCGAVGCPFSCQCRSVDLFDDPSQILTSVTRAASGSSSHGPGYEAPVLLGASGLSLTAPGPTASSTADDPPTRPASPMRSSSSSGSSTPGEPPRIKPLPPQRHNSFQLRDRLYNLLQDESSSSPASSSMPNLTSSHFPSTLTSQHASTSTSASQSRYGSLSRPPPSRTSEISATSEQVYGKPITRASDAAHALERSQQLERGRSSRSRSRSRRKEQEDDAPPPTPDKDVHTSQAPAPSTSRRPETPKTSRSRSTRREESQSRSRSTTTLSYSQSISNFYSAPGPSRTPIYGHPTLKTSNSFRATPPFSSYHSSIGSGKGKMIASSMVHSGVTYA
ncbi:hypothetical protein ARMSODRAFT_368788 [Armillaria solidipes]|uniref:Uncharacterized protein n=1 Tax=Armillaria solidipes TaxID=1076256 RepID=A0A2H3BSQ0_9AGAR|nr:hypothetical protein ARMSODRAFT_368788 [Armillaria solidipes]